MTEGLGRCGNTMPSPWTHPWCARVALLPILPQSAPRRKTAALTRISEGHVGGGLSATEHDQSYRWV